jgi:hypothetical protein
MDSIKHTSTLTALIVGYNESNHLYDCLSSLSFCESIIYVDLDSNDDSINMVKQFKNATIIKYSKTKIIEHVYRDIVPSLECDWLLIMDPDERVTSGLKKSILSLDYNRILKVQKAAAIRFPEKYYFKRKILKGTRWGGIKSRFLIFNRNYAVFTGLVHNGINLKPGFTVINIPYIESEKNYVMHFWCDGYLHFIGKHKRYLKEEAVSKFNTGERTRILHIIIKPIYSFISSYFIEEGYKDGFRGFLLSGLWSWYNTSAYIRLYIYSKKINSTKHLGKNKI